MDVQHGPRWVTRWRPFLLCLALGCGSAVHFDGRTFEKQEAAYRVGELPAGWLPVTVDGQDLAFARPGHGTISVNALCEQYEDVPHTALLNHLLFGFTRRQYRVDEEVVLDGRGARHAIVDAELDGVPVRLEVYLLTRNGCVFDLAHVSAPGAAGGASFDAFVSAFSVQRTRRE